MSQEPARSNSISLGSVLTAVLAVGVLSVSFWAGDFLRGRSSAKPQAVTAATPHANPSLAPEPSRAERLASLGRLVYQVHCVKCHGADGHGDGPDAPELKPSPRDFASPRWRFEPTAKSVREVVEKGIHETGMLSFERILSKNELEAVTLHVMTLAPTRAELLAPQIQKAGLRLVAKRGPAPNFSMTDMKGAKHQIQHYSGKVVIMSFWATSCAPCIAKMPDLEAMAKKHQPDGLCVLPVCVGEPDLDVVAHAIEGRISELEALIDDGLGAVKYDVQSTPTTVVIDRDGSLIARAEGALDWTSPEMLALIQSMLKP